MLFFKACSPITSRSEKCAGQNFAHSNVDKKTPQELSDIIKKDPTSLQAKLICSTENLYKKLKPTTWIILAKSSMKLFEEILKNKPLAEWVNQFPSHDNRGLLMIATFTNEHSFLARDLGENILSDEDMTAIRTRIRTLEPPFAYM